GSAKAGGMIIPAHAASLVRKMLDKGGDCSIGMVRAPTGVDLFVVRYMGLALAVKPIDAQFPPYMQVIPTAYKRLVTVDRAALAGALDRAALVCSSTRGVRLQASDGELTLV